MCQIRRIRFKTAEDEFPPKMYFVLHRQVRSEPGRFTTAVAEHEKPGTSCYLGPFRDCFTHCMVSR